MNKVLFSYKTFSYFHLSDPAGILFFQRVFDLAHQALEQFVNETQLGWSNWFQHPDWAVPLVHCESHYQAPILSGRIIDIDLSLEKTTTSSLTFQYDIKQDSKVCCQVSTTHVFINKDTKNKIPIPEVVLKIFNS